MPKKKRPHGHYCKICGGYKATENSFEKQPKCPPEKEVAIMEALKHFQMI